MRKIISLFQRNYDGDRLVRNEVVPGAEWVQAGEGVATRKFDGTCCMVADGQLYKRFEVKPGRSKPEGFVEEHDDPTTGKCFGWLLVGDGPEDRWHCEAFNSGVDWHGEPFSDGTYELLGPKIQGNPENARTHTLLAHGSIDCYPKPVPTDFDGLRKYLSERDMEGIVWHHPDGRMVKIKGKDFGLRRCDAQIILESLVPTPT
jgi:hypothetical protein